MQIKRRDALKAFGGAAAALAFPATARAAAVLQPNILWLSCEDTSPTLGCYGDPHAHTPTLDALAARGNCFSNAYTVAGVCAPNRSAIISGMWHASLGTHHMRCAASLPPDVRFFPFYLREAGYYCTNNSKTDYQMSKMPKDVWDESSSSAHWKNRAQGQPFFAVFNVPGTHESTINANEESFARLTQALKPEERQNPDSLDLPPYYPDTPAARRDWANHYELVTALDYRISRILDELDEDGAAEDTIVVFWSDHGIGLPRAKRWLYDSGTRVPFIVYIPEKFRHLRPAEPGAVVDRLVNSLDFGPSMLSLAGAAIPEIMQGRAFLGPASGPEREYVFGARDRMDERYDIIRAVRDKRYRYIRNYEPWKPYYQYMATPERGATMKELRRLHAEGKLNAAAELFMAERKPLEELYDLQADPHEIHNLIDSPEHAKTADRLREALERWQREILDLGFLPETEIVVREKEAGSRYAIFRREGGQALWERIREAAILAGRPEQSDRKALERLLDDSDAAVRYWGAIGLGNLGAAAAPARAALASALRDAASCVRIAAARALAAMGEAGEALPVLEAELSGAEEWARLAAAIALDEMGPAARPAQAAFERALEDSNKYVVRVAVHALEALQGDNA